MTRIGLISDTHGLLRPEACSALQGCDRLIHAGDIGDPGILDALSTVAPVIAVRGNNDGGAWAQQLPTVRHLRIEDVGVTIVHDLAQLRRDAMAPDIRVVVSGHSHRPLIRERDGVLYVNPGSAGPRRFRLPVTVAELRVGDRLASAHIIELALGHAT